MSAATPLGPLEVVRRGPGGAASVFDVAPGDPVLAGHYPGFAVLPGVYLIEAVDRTVRDWAGPLEGADGTGPGPGTGPGSRPGAGAGTAAAPPRPRRVELAAMDRCRFRRPVHPGDRVFTDVTVRRDGDVLLCRAAVGTNRGRVADITLRYRYEEYEETDSP
ncbi:hypothetical protein ACFYT4_04550 [Streptomyces sp. NPDC004609]|uniref:hypothetical protein n=1 Tax=Streptomyces sp. NPDC004609 TaxID=3364704 RepID=UPI0036995E8D